MRMTGALRVVLVTACVLSGSCGGGGGGGGSSSSSSSGGGVQPAILSLSVARQPADATASLAFGTQPVVHVRNGSATDTSDNSTVVTASIASGTVGAMLIGSTTATASGGVATFTNLGIIPTGNGYRLQFSAPGMPSVLSDAFDVAAPPVQPVQVTFSIDSAQDVRPISRFIYGLNHWIGTGRPANATLSRSGGNRMTAYNWETNAVTSRLAWRSPRP